MAKLKPSHNAPVGVSAPTVSAGLTGEGVILGTLQYMAPEQLEGKEADAQTDIFAFGALVYEMATGQKAFSGESQASLESSGHRRRDRRWRIRQEGRAGRLLCGAIGAILGCGGQRFNSGFPALRERLLLDDPRLRL